MPSLRALWPMVLALTLGLGGCRKPVPVPSAEYDQAWRLYANLYARQLDDAFGNPAMDQVVALLKQVPASSADDGAAKTLLARIDDGKKALARDRAEQAKLRASLKPDPASPQLLAAAAAVLPSADAGGGEPVAAAEQADAGPPPADPFAPGGSIADLNRDSGGCLVVSEPFKERNTNKSGDAYRLASSAACQSKLPGLQDSVLLVVDGRIYRRVSAKELPASPPPPPAPPPEAAKAPAAPAAPAAAPAQPPPAAEPLPGTSDILQPTQPQPTY